MAIPPSDKVRQGEVTRASLFGVGAGSPPSVEEGWEGVASSERLVAGCRRTVATSSVTTRSGALADPKLSTVGDGGAATVCNVKADDACPPVCI